MEIVRFGVGYRRPEGPRGSRNVTGRVIFSDPRGTISELAFGRLGAIQPYAMPSVTWFVVIEGGGFVRVGDEQSRVAAGEAVLWPPDLLHAAWTEQSQMRAIVVEFASDDPELRAIVEGRGLELDHSPGSPPAPEGASGRLVGGGSIRYDPREGEPL
jgi:quercetin dioxygenase-like cupin family protein